MRWSLDDLYTSFDSEEFKNDYEGMKSEIRMLNEWAAENLIDDSEPVSKAESFINYMNDFSKYYKLYFYSSLYVSVSSSDDKALKILDNLHTVMTDLEKPTVMFKKFITRLNNPEEIIEVSEVLKEHAFYIRKIIEDGKYMLSEQEEIVAAKLETTGSSAWRKMQEQLTSTLLVDINIDGVDKKLPLTQIRNFADEADAELRKKAYFAELEAYKQIETSIAFSLNSIKGEVLTMTKLRGYKSPLEMTLIKSNLNENALNAMLSAMKDYLPIFRDYLKAKSKLLGNTGSLPFYDLFAPVGNIDMRFTYQEAQDFIIKNFNAFSEKLGDLAKTAFDKAWIDAEVRENKRGGAFCLNLHCIKQSRVMSNFSGSFGDVLTLAHELGHAYHGSCLGDKSYLNSRYPMPIAETASTFCETIIFNAALKTASDKEALVILENDISSAAQVIVDIYSRYLFETEVFARRADGVLSSGEFKEIMLNAQREAYGDGLSEEYLHPYMWICKSHYYSASLNFYNFPYAYGLLFSKGLYSLYLNNKEEFLPLYDRLLSETGRNNLADIAKLAGVDICDKEFWISSLKIIEDEIKEFIYLSNTL